MNFPKINNGHTNDYEKIIKQKWGLSPVNCEILDQDLRQFFCAILDETDINKLVEAAEKPLFA